MVFAVVEKVRVVINGSVVWGYRYSKLREDVKTTTSGSVVYRYKRKVLVFKVPRDLENNDFLIIPIPKDLKPRKIELRILE